MTADKTIRELLIEKDEVSLVNLDGTFIGPEDKYEAHTYPCKLHLAISVWLFNAEGQVLLQKRSKQKIVGADWWANTVCGNVWPTETYFDCANRRLRVELGIVGQSVTPVYKFMYKAYGNETYGEYELDQLYVGMFTGEPQPNPEEVQEILWVDFQELFTKVSTLEYISAEESVLLQDEQLQEKTKPVLIQIGTKELQIAPWTIFMLKNTQLYDAFKQVTSQYRAA